MTKRYLNRALLLSLVALPLFATASSYPWPVPATKWSARQLFSKNLHLYIGVDPEPTRNELIQNINFSSTVNFGFTYEIPVHTQWAVGPELWFNQYATPRLTLITDQKTDLDGSRTEFYDTTSVLRMSGYYFGGNVTRHLPHGFSVTGGIGYGKYNKGITEHSARITDVRGALGTSYSSGYSGNTTLPEWFGSLQPGIKLRLEKTFFQRLVIGASVQQGLKDLTKFSDGDKNFSTNFLGYLGLKI